MYGKLGIVEYAIDHCKDEILRDRSNYWPFYRAMEEFISSGDYMLGGKLDLLLSLGVEIDRSIPLVYDIYTVDVFRRAKELCDILYSVDPEGLGKYASVLTKIPGFIVSVAVNFRIICNFICLPYNKGTPTASLIESDEVNGIFSDVKIKTLGELMRNLHICNVLSDVSKKDDWAEYLKYIDSAKFFGGDDSYGLSKLFHVYKVSEVEADKEVESSDLKEMIAQYNIMASAQSTQKILSLMINQFRYFIINDFLVGDQERFIANPKDARGNITIITSNDLEDEAKILCAELKKYGHKLIWHLNDVRLPLEHRLQVLSIGAIINGKRHRVVRLFNESKFSIIPFYRSKTHPGIKSLTLFAEMKYILIEIWLDSLFDKNNNAYRSALFKAYNNLRSQVISDAHFKIFSKGSYGGNYETMELSIKKIAKDLAYNPPPYFAVSKE